MARIENLRVLTEQDPIPYTDKLLVYFVFIGDEDPIILTTRYVAEKSRIISWMEEAVKDKTIRIVVVWPGCWRSEAFLVDPKVALKEIKEEEKYRRG